jgi:hypothetical protein
MAREIDKNNPTMSGPAALRILVARLLSAMERPAPDASRRRRRDHIVSES